MRYGFFGLRGVNQLLNQNGTGIYFELYHAGRCWDRIFSNIGQPAQSPPRHLAHKDNLQVNDNVELLACALSPFYAKYAVAGNNSFEWAEHENRIYLRAECSSPVCFRAIGSVAAEKNCIAIGEDFFLSGIELDREYSGRIELCISDQPVAMHKADRKIFDRASSFVPEGALLPALASVFFNLSVSPLLSNSFYVPVNKVWTGFLADIFNLEHGCDGPLIFAWDGSFASMILAEFDLSLARSSLFSVLEGMTADGRVPQLRIGSRISNRTNPPIWFLAARKIYQLSSDRQFAEAIYPLLLKNYFWFKKNRLNADFTFSWGTDNEQDSNLLLITGKAGAVHESGLDDSPLFNQMDFVDARLDHACIDLSSIMFLACEVLVFFAEQLGGTYQSELPELRSDLQGHQRAVHQFFCSQQQAVNSFRTVDGERQLCSTLTPLCFYPMLTSFINKSEVDILKKLFYSVHFSGKAGLPSLSTQHAEYNGDGDYWRGRIWPPMVYLTAKGFEKYDREIYQEIKESSELLLLHEWQRHRHVHENYSAETGQGEPAEGVYARSCPLYSWGGLLGVI